MLSNAPVQGEVKLETLLQVVVSSQFSPPVRIV
jgi:hypothetical protein